MMNSVLGANLAVLVGLVIVGVPFCWGILHGLDRLSGISFSKDVFPKITEDPIATAIYFGARFIGVLYFISAMLSRFV